MRNKIEINNYKIINKKIKGKGINIVHISDIHYSSIKDIDNLNNIKNKINLLNPDYICITGDNIDSLKYLKDNSSMDMFYEWIHNLGLINNKKVPVLISIGNHDMSGDSIDNNKYNEYLNKLKYDNVYVLDNSYYEDDFIYVLGITYPKKLIYKICIKDVLEFYNNIDKKLLIPTKNKLNIALIHSPINIIDIKDKLKYFDLILSGHMHNGMVPYSIGKLIKNNYGLISPNKTLFPKIARGIKELNKDKYLIISGGITKLSASAGILHYINNMYPSEIENINIISNKE